MNCIQIFEKNNYSDFILNVAFNDDSGTWWWWINIIGTLLFGLIGLIGNLICFLVVYRNCLNEHSFVVYLGSLSLFHFLALIFELNKSLNQLFIYLFKINLLNLNSSILCKLYDYSKYSIILLSCWTIVILTIDRYIIVCDPFKNKCVNLSNLKSAKCILLILILISLLINVPHLLYKNWICRPGGFQYSAQYNNNKSIYSNKTISKICSCRISPNLKSIEIKFFIFWNNYIFHLLFYTLIPGIILITTNIGILKEIHKPREISSKKAEYIRSRITSTLRLVSLLFLMLYIPYALVQTFSYKVLDYYKSNCNIYLIIRFIQLKRLCELLNIIALGINFFFYILRIKHYRSSAIQMLHLDYFHLFRKYLIHQNSKIKFKTSINNHLSSQL